MAVKGQLGVALSVKDELNLDFNIISLVKDDKHTTKALINEEGDEISVSKNLLTLAAIQNEGHRYAITSHRAKKRERDIHKRFRRD